MLPQRFQNWWTETRLAALLSLGAAWLFFIEYLPPLRRVHLIWDIQGYHHPLLDYALHSLRAGRLPEWDPAIYCGVSFAGNLQAGLFYPPTWLLFAANWTRPSLSFMSIQILVALHFALALLFTYLWLRERDAGRIAASLGALSFAFSGFFLNEVQHLGATEAVIWIPFVLWGLTQASRRRSWRPLWKVAVGSALSLLAGFPFIWVVLCAAAVVYAVTLPARRWLAPACLAALAASLLLCMVQILPAREAASMKVFRLGYGGGPPSAGQYFTLIAPNYFDQGRLVTPGFEESYLYLGVAALFAIGWLLRRGAIRAAAPGLILAVATQWVMFDPFRLLARIIQPLSPANQMIREWNFLAGLPLASALLVAAALDDYRKRPARPRTALAPLALAASAAWIVRQIMISRSAGVGFLSGWASLAETAAALLCFALGLFAFRAEARLPWRRALLAALFLLAFVDLKVYGTNRRFSAAGGNVDRELGNDIRMGGPEHAGWEVAVFNQIRSNPQYRVVYNENPSFPDVRHYGIVTPQGSDPMFPQSYKTELENNQAAFTADRMFQIEPGRPALLQQLGVRYVAAHRDQPFHEALRNNPRFRLLGKENAFFAIFEYVDALAVYRWPAGAVTCSRWTPELHEFTLNSPAGGDFALIENRFPGWSAFIDGRPTAIRPYATAFQQVAVPPGPHTLRFEYRAQGLRLGALISLAACIALVAALALTRPAAQTPAQTGHPPRPL